MVGTGKLPRKSAQAAVWHLSDNMSWEQLQQKYKVYLGRGVPYFTNAELHLARKMFDHAAEIAGRSKDSGETQTVAQTTPRTE